MIKPGDRLPGATPGYDDKSRCPLSPQPVEVETLTKGKKVLVEDGVVKTVNVEAPGKFEVSGADTMLRQV